MKEIGKSMLDGMREYTINKLIDDGSVWFSGYITESDIEVIEQRTNKKVLCSAESGEYFYKLDK